MQERSVKRSLSWFLIIMIIITTLQIRGCRGCFETERIGLLELKAFLDSFSDGANADENTPVSWPDDRKSDCCRWERIKCNATTRRVIELALSDSLGYNGYHLLNLSLFHPFEELRSLDLSVNYFGGWFDDIEGYKSFERLKKLEILKLGYNAFNNSILPFLSAATSLRILNFTSNTIEGVFPPKELANLRNLRVLDVSNNGFNRVSTQGFENLTKLKALDLSDNNFSGYLQVQGICQMLNLLELDLSHNKFGGHLPSCLRNLTNLRVLDVSSNQFGGNPSSFLGDITSLEHLSLYDNNFEGSFSLSSFANLSKLEVFSLSSKSKPGMLQLKGKGSWLPTFQLRVLRLQNCNINGTVPQFLLNQHELQSIDLSNNNLVGLVPAWLLQNNPKLKSVYLANNSFTELQLPEVMHGLLTLEISENKIFGPLPENIGVILLKLKYLSMPDNALQGGIPSSMGEMKSLQILDLSRNNLSGGLPKNFLSSCGALRILKLSNNSFHGEIFPEYANLTGLMVLLVDNNNFGGNIGRGLLNSVFLNYLDVSNNKLAGRIPEWIGRLYLFYLSMRKNQLEAEIPVQLQNLTNLDFLDLSENRLSGYIPSNFSFPQLEHLYLQNNDLVGPIPASLFDSTNLVMLDMRNNKLSGHISKSLYKLSLLSVLLLRGNGIMGHIPNEICLLRKIVFLDLSHNKLDGCLPSCLSNMSFGIAEDKPSEVEPVLYAYNADDFLDTNPQHPSILALPFLRRDIVEGFSPLTVEFETKSRYESFKGDILLYMNGLDLSSNKLTGHIPKQIGDLHLLHALNLSHNHFSGSIPDSLANLEQIESLDLSYNRLQGIIPSQLAELYTLGEFNVSYNNLSGTIPYKGQLAAFDERSYVGNSGLCGLPTNVTCGNSEVPTTAATHLEEEDAELYMEWFYWSFCATYATTLFGLFVFLCIDTDWSRAWFYLVDACIYRLQCLIRTYF